MKICCFILFVLKRTLKNKLKENKLDVTNNVRGQNQFAN